MFVYLAVGAGGSARMPGNYSPVRLRQP
jgi:hypothetical protein